MNPEPLLTDITHTIQLAVAPVFLLTAVSTTLSVFTVRLARIVDRARRVEELLAAAPPIFKTPYLIKEMLWLNT